MDKTDRFRVSCFTLGLFMYPGKYSSLTSKSGHVSMYETTK